jgi:putative hydrolase of the HAD superfamily
MDKQNTDTHKRYSEGRKPQGQNSEGQYAARPKMIMFDYGQTLLTEERFNGEAGNKAVIKLAKSNPYHVTGKQMQEFAVGLSKDIGRFMPDPRKGSNIEVHNHIFQNYLYEYYGLEFEVSKEELERVFWDNAAPTKATEHIRELLQFLNESGIRTAVISNISFSGNALKERIHKFLPENHFEFIMATSEYVFRKPHNRIFELALRKAGLQPKDVWYCGDNAYFDVEGALKAGIYPVWYKGALDPENRLVPDYECLTIHDWRELIDRLK